jgi:branched-chain amino acid transport system permease protein
VNRLWPAFAWLAALLFAGWLYALGDPYWMRLGTSLAVNIALASAWNLIGGFAGYPSFATAAFFGLGAYAGALVQAAGWPMPLAWAAASAAAGCLALVVGWVVLRLRGHYFAIGSLTIVIMLRLVATNWTDLTGGGMGFNLPVLQTDVIDQARLFFVAQTSIALLAVLVATFVARSSLGFALVCIRQNETAAGMLGLDARAAKAAAFILSAMLIAPAGAIYASSVFYIEPGDVFDVQMSLTPIVTAMLGGAGTVGGPVIGAILFEVLEQTVWARFVSIHAGVLGLSVVLLALFLPRGLFGLGLRWRRRPA